VPILTTVRDPGNNATPTEPRAAFPDPLVVCGPSGVGKGTLIARLLQRHPAAFGFSTSHTTRAPRPGERDGYHYFFITDEDFDGLREQGGFLEHAEVHGNKYGTSVRAVETVRASNRVCILDIDAQGVRSLQSTGNGPIGTGWTPRYIFIAPPSLEDLEARLRGRATETEEAMARRLSNAADEVAFGLAPGNFDHVVVNGDLDDAFGDLEATLKVWYPGQLNDGDGGDAGGNNNDDGCDAQAA